MKSSSLSEWALPTYFQILKILFTFGSKYTKLYSHFLQWISFKYYIGKIKDELPRVWLGNRSLGFLLSSKTVDVKWLIAGLALIKLGMPGWLSRLSICLYLAQVMIPGSWDQALHQAPCSVKSLLLPASPAVFSHTLSVKSINKILKKTNPAMVALH